MMEVLQEIKAQNDKLLQEVEAMKGQLSLLDGKYQVILASLADNKKELEALKSQIDALKAQIAQQLIKIDQLSAQLTQQGADIIKLSQEIKELKASCEELKDKIEELLQGRSPVPTNGLVAWYPFNGNANDESGNGNNGIVNGASLTIDRFDNNNSAYSFQQNHIAIPLTKLIFDMEIRTVTLWFKSKGAQNGGRLFEATNYSWGVGCYNSTKFDAWFYKSNKAYNSIDNDFSNHNLWHNLIYVSDAKNFRVKVYLNGIPLYNSEAVTFIGDPRANAWQNYFIKIGQGNANESFLGVIDDFGIWNRELSPDEISKIYKGEKF
jgi:hypothetical protein